MLDSLASPELGTAQPQLVSSIVDSFLKPVLYIYQNITFVNYLFVSSVKSNFHLQDTRRNRNLKKSQGSIFGCGVVIYLWPFLFVAQTFRYDTVTLIINLQITENRSTDLGRSFVVRLSFVRHSFVIRSPFVRSSFIRVFWALCRSP